MQVTQCYLLATTFRGRDDCRSMRWKSSLKSNFFFCSLFKDFAKLLFSSSSHTKMSIKWSSSNNRRMKNVKSWHFITLLLYYSTYLLFTVLTRKTKKFTFESTPTNETCSYHISRPKMPSNEAASMIYHTTFDILLVFSCCCCCCYFCFSFSWRFHLRSSSSSSCSE